MKSGARLAFAFVTPTIIDSDDRAVAADQRDLLDWSFDNFLNLLDIHTVIGFVLPRGSITRDTQPFEREAASQKS